jgi:hypothetical protein
MNSAIAAAYNPSGCIVRRNFGCISESVKDYEEAPYDTRGFESTFFSRISRYALVFSLVSGPT